MSGFGVAAARYGLPDNGLIGYAEMVETLRLICAANPDMAVDRRWRQRLRERDERPQHRRWVRSGRAAAIMIEDQVTPKRCGHMEGKTVVPLDEARTRIRAAVDARRESGLDILIVARTTRAVRLRRSDAPAACVQR